MAKGILEFDLEDFDDRLAHKRAVYSTDAFLALYDIQALLRTIYKSNCFNSKELSDDTGDFFDSLRDRINDIIIERVNMDDLP